MNKKPQYIKCPRCELNYIQKKAKYCDICKAELKLLDPSMLLPDDDSLFEELCPYCNENPVPLDSDMCAACAEKINASLKVNEDEALEKEWSEFIAEENDEPVIDDEIEISLSELEETEEAEVDDEDEDLYPEPDDFDYDVDESEFEDLDEDEDEEEEDDEF